MNNFQHSFYLFLVIGLLLVGCGKEPTIVQELKVPNLPSETYDYMSGQDNLVELRLPEPEILQGLVESPLGVFNINSASPRVKTAVSSDESATLGRVLFYDPSLSKNNTISCASCHQQSKAFSDGSVASIGFGGKETSRNSMAFPNLAFNNNFFWDSRQHDLGTLISEPITNHIEMGMEDVGALIEKLSNKAFYPELFNEAYGSPEITHDNLGLALTDFLASITSTDATFDRAIENDFEDYTELQKLGMGLFFSSKTQCSSCHAGVNFAADDDNGSEYQLTSGTANIGLDVEYEDNGRFAGQFKIPSLRNISLTAPYMHDGRFETLRAVLDHYNGQVQPHANLDDKLLANGIPQRLNLSSIELDALEAFLNTLTDVELLNDPKYSNPFL